MLKYASELKKAELSHKEAMRANCLEDPSKKDTEIIILAVFL